MLTGIPDNYRFYLASRSPRRQQLMREAGIRFEIIERDFDESYPAGLSGRKIAEYLAASKASCFPVNEITDNQVIITADTIVWCNGMVLDKPSDEKEAFKILTTISGNTHEVITGVCLATSKGYHTFSEITRVTFDELTDEEINYYIKKYRPFDKAGAYGIQEWIGIIGNSRIDGSYFNVMGLPVQRMVSELKKIIGNKHKNR